MRPPSIWREHPWEVASNQWLRPRYRLVEIHQPCLDPSYWLVDGTRLAWVASLHFRSVVDFLAILIWIGFWAILLYHLDQLLQLLRESWLLLAKWEFAQNQMHLIRLYSGFCSLWRTSVCCRLQCSCWGCLHCWICSNQWMRRDRGWLQPVWLRSWNAVQGDPLLW